MLIWAIITSHIGIQLGSGDYGYMPPYSSQSYYSKAECEDALRSIHGAFKKEVVKVRSAVVTSAEYPQGDPYLYLHIQTDPTVDAHSYHICVAIPTP